MFSELVIKQYTTKQLFCTSRQNLCKIPGKDIIFSKYAALRYDKVSNCTKKHSHKKRKDSLETRAELTVLRTLLRTKLYQNPVFFTGHQNLSKPKSRAAKTIYGLIFLPFYEIIVSFFSFLCRDAKKQDQTVL